MTCLPLLYLLFYVILQYLLEFYYEDLSLIVIPHRLCPVPINSEQYSFTVHAF